MKLQLKRSLKTITNSTLAQAPSVDQMEYGEIAVNYVSSDPSLFLKDSTNVIRKMQLGILPDLDVSTEQSGTLDDRYILNTGDALTGNLSAPSFIGGVARMSAVAPAAGEDGELWWNNNDGRLYIYYNDGVTTQWVDASPDSFTLGAGYYDKNEADARYIAKAGGIMTGILQLAGNPATALAASPKQYVDSQTTAAQTAAENFATAAIAAIPATDLSSYDTSVQVDAKIAASTPDLSNYSGNATFDGYVKAGTNLICDTTSSSNGLYIGDFTNGNYYATIFGDGSASFAGETVVKGDLLKRTAAGTTVVALRDDYLRVYDSPVSYDDYTISLEKDGSASFGGDVNVGGYDGTSTTTDGCLFGAGGGVYSQLAATTPATGVVFQGMHGDSYTSRITANGKVSATELETSGVAGFRAVSPTDSGYGIRIVDSTYSHVFDVNYQGNVNAGRIITVKGGAGSSGTIQLNCENNSHGVMIKGPAHSAGAAYTLTLPPNAGNSNQVLTTDGTGSLTWTTPTANADLTNYDTSTEVDAKITSAALSLSSLPALP